MPENLLRAIINTETSFAGRRFQVVGNLFGFVFSQHPNYGGEGCTETPLDTEILWA